MIKGYEVVIGLETHAELNTDSKYTVTAKISLVLKLIHRCVRFVWVCQEHCLLLMKKW